LGRKIIYLVTEDWYFCSHRLPLAVAAKEAGYDVIVATRVQKHGEQILEAGLKLVPITMLRRSPGLIHELKSVWEIIRLYRAERPDIVHHVALKPVVFGGIAARLASVSLVINAVAGLGFMFTAQSWRVRAIRPIFSGILRLLLVGAGRRVIVQNDDDAAMLGNLSKSMQLHVIRGAGVDIQAFRPFSTPAKDFSDELTVVLAARMIWDKGVGEFVGAARMLKKTAVPVRMILVGDSDDGNPMGIPRAQLESWQADGIIEWWGRREDMQEVYAQADIVCLPTYYREGVPKVLLEAAACGLPIITTDVPGCRDVVRHEENGLLIAARDASAIAEAVSKLLDGPELRKSMGAFGRARVAEQFSLDHVVAAILRLYELDQER